MACALSPDHIALLEFDPTVHFLDLPRELRGRYHLLAKTDLYLLLLNVSGAVLLLFEEVVLVAECHVA